MCSLYRGFVFSSFFFHVFYCYWAEEHRSLYRALCYMEVSLYRGSTVLMPTPPPSRLHHFEHLYPQFTLSINIGAFVYWEGVGGRINQRSNLYPDMYLPS